MRHLPTDAVRRLTRQIFNGLAFGGGKKHAGDQSAGRRTTPLGDHPGDTVHRLAKWWWHPARRCHPRAPRVAPGWFGPTGSGRAERPSKGFDHPARVPARRSCPSVSVRIGRAYDRAWLISPFPSRTIANPTTRGTIRQIIYRSEEH